VKRGYLERHEDVSGVSGTGNVAELAIGSNGKVAIFWPGPDSSVNVFDSLQAIKNVHGHNGKTDIVILDDEVEDAPHCEACHDLQSCPHLICPGCAVGVT
jgi:hypothetical protein